MRRDIGPRDGQRAGFAAAAVVLLDLLRINGADKAVDGLERILLLHRAVARVVIHVARARDAFELDAFLEQEFMNIDDTATGEDFFKLVAL